MHGSLLFNPEQSHSGGDATSRTSVYAVTDSAGWNLYR
jgi:hypothetical protein